MILDSFGRMYIPINSRRMSRISRRSRSWRSMRKNRMWNRRRNTKVGGWVNYIRPDWK